MLTALGGEPRECVEILGTWEGHKDDLRVLVLASRGPGDLFKQIEEHLLRRAQRGGAPGPARNALTSRRARFGRGTVTASTVGGWVGYAPLSGGMRRAWPGSWTEQDEVLTLLGLRGGIPDRLVATVLATWAERVSVGDDRVATERSALIAALHGRVAVALRTWLSEPDLPITVDMIGPSDPPELFRESEGIRARLPFRWLIDVWARGVPVVLGRFTIGLTDSEDKRQRVLTVDTDLRDVRPVTISLG
jgi:hypothetical protein